VLSITLERAAAWAGIIGVLIAALALWLYLVHRRRGRIEAAEQLAREELAAKAERQRLLEETPATFSAKAWPPYGGPGRPERAPLAVRVHRASAWIHEVRFSYGARDRGVRSAADGLRCVPWAGDLPVQLQPEGRELQLDWPGPPMVEPEAISWELDIVWSAERHGPTTTVIVPGGDTNWQQA
jgi:hypothetical protein